MPESLQHVNIDHCIAMVIAVRQALDFTAGKAILTCIVGWIVMVAILAAVGLLIAIPFYI